MTKVLVTGSAGFIGKHLVEALGRRQDCTVIGYDLGNTAEDLQRALEQADVIFHLAGVNRPKNRGEYAEGNAGFTKEICDRLEALGRSPVIAMASSIQAALDNPYGVSKKQAEDALRGWASKTRGSAVVFRLKNVFGKWCRPNYNSVTATFCHNIAHGLPITISDPAHELELVYIDDVVEAFVGIIQEIGDGRWRREMAENFSYREVKRSFRVTLGELAAKIRSFRDSRHSLRLPSFEDEFTRCLYATYLSYLEGPEFAYGLDIKTDNRGELAEFMKSAQFGQIFVSRTKPGITRGNHYHHSKTEKFLVVEGEAVVRFRSVMGDGRREMGDRSSEMGDGTQGSGFSPPPSEVIEHRVSGKDFRVIDIPPGYTHSIENVGSTEMVVLFWASEIFDPARPDTYAARVMKMEDGR